MSKKEKHPTIFVMDGSIHVFEEGTMLELHTQITQDEWAIIVDDTVKYKVFLESLKEIMPKLHEPWDENDEWYMLQLGVAVSRMRNIDPLLVSKYDQKKIREDYLKWMNDSADGLLDYISKIKEEQRELLKEKYNMKVSDL